MKDSSPAASLAHQIVVADGASPQRFILFLHGVFGMGTNFRAVARAIVSREPSWGVVLVDLRGHGATPALAPPHDLGAAAGDLERLCERLASEGRPVRGVIGHSFGGKVALALVARRPLDLLVLLDSQPGPRDEAPENDSATSVLAILESLDRPWSAREDFSAALRERGLSQAIVDWLTMNVRKAGEDYRLRLDLAAIRAMLEDYFAADLFWVLEDPSRAGVMGVVIGGRSTVLGARSKERLWALAGEGSALRIVELPAAGHWVHVDDPQGVVDFAVELLRSPIFTGGSRG
ncbi:MAG: alpha/beta hydrolase [Polyangiaceae bacterium]|jgi:esterase|nr:alpha/beta hydrolase [Polyangiaceae bacterium]MBK8937482.1 alpha/beta hydrolase [Polyangiaceae bacterium]